MAAIIALPDPLGLAFDPVQHRYYLSGSRVPNVTGVLEPLTDYSRIPPAVLELARRKGTDVHRMIELDARDDLDRDTLPAWMLPVLIAWHDFLKHTGFRIIYSEFRLYHPDHGYAGTGDLYGVFEHGKRPRPALIDIKRSFLAGFVIGMQTDAYKAALSCVDKDAKQAERFALRLSDKAAPRIRQYTRPADFGDFLSCLNYKRLMEQSKHANAND